VQAFFEQILRAKAWDFLAWVSMSLLARLANTVEGVGRQTADAKTEIGVRIDLREMKKHGSFIRPRLARPKNPSKVSGTRIEIYDFKPDAQNLLKPQEIVREIGRTYSSQISSLMG